MNVLAMFQWDCGRHGEVSGIFACDKDVLTSAYGSFVNFGNVLGGGVEISGVLEPDDITVLSEGREVVDKVQAVYGETIEGLNPLMFLQHPDTCFSESY